MLKTSAIKPLYANGFSRAVRVTQSKDYKTVLEKKPVAYSSMFALHQSKSSEADGARLGLIVGKRFAKSAVVRNTIKRCIREVFRKERVFLPTFDFVVRLKAKVPSVSNRKLKKMIQHEVKELLSGRVKARC